MKHFITLIFKPIIASLIFFNLCLFLNTNLYGYVKYGTPYYIKNATSNPETYLTSKLTLEPDVNSAAQWIILGKAGDTSKNGANLITGEETSIKLLNQDSFISYDGSSLTLSSNPTSWVQRMLYNIDMGTVINEGGRYARIYYGTEKSKCLLRINSGAAVGIGDAPTTTYGGPDGWQFVTPTTQVASQTSTAQQISTTVAETTTAETTVSAQTNTTAEATPTQINTSTITVSIDQQANDAINNAMDQATILISATELNKIATGNLGKANTTDISDTTRNLFAEKIMLVGGTLITSVNTYASKTSYTETDKAKIKELLDANTALLESNTTISNFIKAFKPLLTNSVKTNLLTAKQKTYINGTLLKTPLTNLQKNVTKLKALLVPVDDTIKNELAAANKTTAIKTKCTTLGNVIDKYKSVTVTTATSDYLFNTIMTPIYVKITKYTSPLTTARKNEKTECIKFFTKANGSKLLTAAQKTSTAAAIKILNAKK